MLKQQPGEAALLASMVSQRGEWLLPLLSGAELRPLIPELLHFRVIQRQGVRHLLDAMMGGMVEI